MSETADQPRAINVRVPVVVCQCGAHAVMPHWWKEEEPATNHLLCDCDDRHASALYHVTAALPIPRPSVVAAEVVHAEIGRKDAALAAVVTAIEQAAEIGTKPTAPSAQENT